MCLIVLNWQPGATLRVSANRDEFFQRLAAPLHSWQDFPNIIAGRDLTQGGTWLGINRQYQFAALTNVRVLGVGPDNPPSRGELVTQFLNSEQSAEQWSEQLLTQAAQYAPFNLLLGDVNSLWYISNYPQPNRQPLSAGTHVLSNAQLNSPWPKALLATEQLQHWLEQPAEQAFSLAKLLQHDQPFADSVLPHTGVSKEWERLLSAQFIRAPGYGTLCSTGLILTPSSADICEITWPEDLTEPTTVHIKV